MAIAPRPPGSVPPPATDQARGLAATAILAGVACFLVVESLVPVLRNGVDVMRASLLPVIGVTGLVGALMVGAIMRPRGWAGGLGRVLGWAVLGLYAGGLLFGTAVLAGLVPRAAPDLGFASVVNIVFWVLVSPLAWLVLRMLRADAAVH